VTDYRRVEPVPNQSGCCVRKLPVLEAWVVARFAKRDSLLADWATCRCIAGDECMYCKDTDWRTQLTQSD
jgi:hypothetical protein